MGDHAVAPGQILHRTVAIANVAYPSCSLLNDPNTGSPANVEASNLYKDNRKEYTKRVRETVEKSWED
jgi:ubiquitin-conjugating enzyme E2 A